MPLGSGARCEDDRVKTSDRLGSTIWGMLLTIGLCFGVVAIIALFTFKPAQPEVRVVDYQPTAANARANGAFKVATPSPVPTSWQATSVRYLPSALDPGIATWHLGFYIPEDGYAAVAQTNGTDPAFISESTVSGRPEGSEVIDGVTWTHYYSEDKDRRSLVSKTGQITTIVTGTLTYPELAVFASSLATS